MSSDAPQDVPAGVARVTVQLQVAEGKKRTPVVWGVAEEVAVEIDLNGEPLAVTMASPTDLSELAVGFVFTEGVVPRPAEILDVQPRQTLDGWIVDLQVPAHGIDPSARRGRLLEGRAGCGLCGVDTLSAAMRRPPVKGQGERGRVADAALNRAFSSLSDHQPLNAATRSVHAAAWCAMDGDIVHVCEDLGRHNALDKLVGWLLGNPAPDPGFVLLSSRVSYELVCKAAASGASLLAAVSAPTTLAVELARRAGLPMAFTGPDGRVARIG